MPRIQNSRTCGSGYCLACARRGSGMWSNTSSSDAIRAPSIGFPKCHSAPSSRHPWENRTALAGNDRKKYAQQYADYTTNVKQFILDASYNGKTLIGNITGHTGTFGDAGVTQNEVG